MNLCGRRGQRGVVCGAVFSHPGSINLMWFGGALAGAEGANGSWFMPRASGARSHSVSSGGLKLMSLFAPRSENAKIKWEPRTLCKWPVVRPPHWFTPPAATNADPGSGDALFLPFLFRPLIATLVPHCFSRQQRGAFWKHRLPQLLNELIL